MLILGAGCSLEAPTEIPLAGELAADCCRKLVADGILSEDEVEDAYDLSAVADAVHESTGGQQALIDRFPLGKFRQAEPNEGYLIMAALLIEGAVATALTLNFDLTARTALGTLGAADKVSTVRGPQEHAQLGTRNLIYLHRDIDCPADDLILREAVLEEAWQNGWEEVIAGRVLATPFVVFVGLGSPAAVLIETTKRIQAVTGSSSSLLVVDPTPRDQSRFAQALEIASGEYFRMGWSEFMRALALRVVEEHRASVEGGCANRSSEIGLEPEDVGDLCRRLAEMGIVELGQLRASWMLERGSYLPHQDGPRLDHFCDLVLAVRMVERESGRQARFNKDGFVDFVGDGNITRVMLCSGAGSRNRASVETALSMRRDTLSSTGAEPLCVLVGGVELSAEVATPPDIIADTDPDDLIWGPGRLRMVSIASLRADPGRVSEVIP